MYSDLFSTFDYGFGVVFMEMSVVLWVSSMVFMFLIICSLSYWLEGCRLEGAMSIITKSFSNNLSSYQISNYGSGVLFVLALFMVLLSMNLFGMGPYIFSASCHFVFAMSFSFSLWVSMFLFNIFTNWVSFFGSFVLPDLPVVGSMVMVWIELLSNLIRALTLSLRLCLNLASGQIIMGLLGSFSNILVVSGPTMAGVFCSLGCGVLLIMDLFIAVLQAMLFVGLVVMYMDELVLF